MPIFGRAARLFGWVVVLLKASGVPAAMVREFPFLCLEAIA